MGCAALALAAFGIHFSFVCVEPNSVFRQAVSSCFSNVLHFAHVPTFQPQHLPDGWRNFRFWLILVVGNARCSGPGANSVHHARRVANACSKIWSSACVWAICEGPCLPVKGCSLCPVGPVVTDAADWGRVSRWQDWFLWCSHRLVAGGFTSAPVEQEVASEARKPVMPQLFRQALAQESPFSWPFRVEAAQPDSSSVSNAISSACRHARPCA